METYYEMETYLSGRIHTDKNKKPINFNVKNRIIYLVCQNI